MASRPFAPATERYLLVKSSDKRLIAQARVPVAVIHEDAAEKYSGPIRSHIPVTVDGKSVLIRPDQVMVSRVYLPEFSHDNNPAFHPSRAPVMMPWPETVRREFDKARVRNDLAAAFEREAETLREKGITLKQPQFRTIDVRNNSLDEQAKATILQVQGGLTARNGRAIYLKPTNGSQGNGVVRISRAGRNLLFETNDKELNTRIDASAPATSITDFLNRIYLPHLGNLQDTTQLVLEDEINGAKILRAKTKETEIHACELRVTLAKGRGAENRAQMSITSARRLPSELYDVTGFYGKEGPNAVASNISAGGTPLNGLDMARTLLRQRYGNKLTERQIESRALAFIEEATRTAQWIGKRFHGSVMRSLTNGRNSTPEQRDTARRTPLGELTVDFMPAFDGNGRLRPHFLEVNAGRMALSGLYRMDRGLYETVQSRRVRYAERLWMAEVSRRKALAGPRYAFNVAVTSRLRNKIGLILDKTTRIHAYTPSGEPDHNFATHVALSVAQIHAHSVTRLLRELGLNVTSRPHQGRQLLTIERASNDEKRYSFFAENIAAMAGHERTPLQLNGEKQNVRTTPGVEWHDLSEQDTFTLGISARRLSGKSRSDDDFFGDKTTDLQRICEEGYRLGVRTVVYNNDNIDKQGKLVRRGYAWNPTQRTWERIGPFALPHATIPRLHGRISREDSDWLSQHSPYLNPKPVSTATRDKSLTSRILIGAGLPHPQTYGFNEVASGKSPSFGTLLDKHGIIFIKPNSAEGGYGVIKAEKRGGGMVALKYKLTDDHAPVEKTVRESAIEGELRKAFVSIAETAGKPKLAVAGRYIVQHGIDIGMIDEKPWSTRFIITRTDDGTTAGRLSHTGTGTFVSTVPGGYGSNFNSETADTMTHLAAIYGEERASSIFRKAREISLRAARAMEEHVGKRHPGRLVGQVGVEMAFDKQGNPHVIEINGAPWLGRLQEKDRRASCRGMVQAAMIQARTSGTFKL